jgi:LysM repeat protein
VGSVRKATWRQYLFYLGLNVVVSAITVLIVLSLWDRRDRTPIESPTATIDVIGQVASAVPTTAPTKAPSPTPHIYIIQSGDTLLAIAQEYGISIDDLMSTNRLESADSLTAGQELIIPKAEGASGPSATSEVDSQTTATSTPSEGGAVQGEVIISAIDSPGNYELEAVRLLNTGGEVSMAGWTLDDGQGNVFTFPAFTFYSTGAIDVHTREGTNTTIDLYWGLDEPVWLPGTTIHLRDASGSQQSNFTIPDN